MKTAKTSAPRVRRKSGFLRMLGAGWLAIALLAATLHLITKNQFPMVDLCAGLLALAWAAAVVIEAMGSQSDASD